MITLIAQARVLLVWSRRKVYRGIYRRSIGLYGDSGKENGSYYLGVKALLRLVMFQEEPGFLSGSLI